MPMRQGAIGGSGPADSDRLESGLARVGGIGATGGQTIMPGVVPGRYRVFAFETIQGWEMLQRPDALKALESRGQSVDVAEGETVQAALDVIAAGVLDEVLDKSE